MIQDIFNNHIHIPFIGGLLLCAILAAIMSTADSQLLAAASSISRGFAACATVCVFT